MILAQFATIHLMSFPLTYEPISLDMSYDILMGAGNAQPNGMQMLAEIIFKHISW